MIGTHADEVDATRLIPSDDGGWWFIGNRTWTLLHPEQVMPDGTLRADAETFLREHGAYRPRVPRSFSLTVLTSTVCNLGCGYCFQNTGVDPTGGNRPPRIDRERLTDGTISRIIDFTAAQMARAELDKLFLLLFGGEPLLNPRGCLRLLERAAGIGMYQALMATNGVLLTAPLAASLYTAGLRGVQVTFDGSREDHDRIRVDHAGGGTFDTIVDNVAAASDATGLMWNLRVNVSHHNVDRVGDLVGQLRDRIDPARCTMTFAWVGDAGFGYDNDLRPATAVEDGFVAWSIAAQDAGFRITRPGMKATCQICTVPGGRFGAVVNADGTLYSSWQSAGKPGFEVGNVETGYLDVATVPHRWVTCGYEYRRPDTDAMGHLRDRIDSRLLDHLHRTGRL